MFVYSRTNKFLLPTDISSLTSLPNTPLPHDNNNPSIPKSLNLTNKFQQLYYEPHNSNNYYSTFGTFDALSSASESISFGGNDGGGGVTTKKRSRESTGDADDENAIVHRRYKRMIKNREAAARSRARKQAYITGLELEVAHLGEENARLRKQQQKIRLIDSSKLTFPTSTCFPSNFGSRSSEKTVPAIYRHGNITITPEDLDLILSFLPTTQHHL